MPGAKSLRAMTRLTRIGHLETSSTALHNATGYGNVRAKAPLNSSAAPPLLDQISRRLGGIA